MVNRDYSEQDRKALIGLARHSIASGFDRSRIKRRDSGEFLEKKQFQYNQFLNEEQLMEKFSEKRGAFVTITINNSLRGCIGYIEPIFPLYEAVAKAAKHAAFEDSRFSPLTEEEFDKITIDVTILHPPKTLDIPTGTDKDLRKKIILSSIEIGKHGLIVSNGQRSGLLLPQVAVEWKWSKEEFIEHTCLKAGLNRDSWLDSKTSIQTFEGEIVHEEN